MIRYNNLQNKQRLLDMLNNLKKVRVLSLKLK